MNARLSPLLFGASLALLAFEITTMRLLAYMHWYHFAYLVISLGLLGFAASGTAMHLGRRLWLAQPQRSAGISLLSAALSISMGRHLLPIIPSDLFLAVWQPQQLLWLAALLGLLFLPFFFTAFFIILCFTLAPARIGRLYAANLLGSAAGCMIALLLLDLLPPAAIPYVLGLGMALLALPLLRLPALIGVGVCALLPLASTPVAMSTYKPLARALTLPAVDVLARKPTPMGMIEVVRSPHLRYAPGLGLNYTGDVPSRPLLFVDGELLGAVATRSRDDLGLLRQALASLPYRLRKNRRVLVLGAGGEEVKRALIWGAQQVTAVEKNAAISRLLARLQAPGASVYLDERVDVANDHPRAFLARNTRRFDLIVLAQAEGLLGASFGMQALHAKHLLTREAFARMLADLTPQGMLVAAAVLDEPPRRPLKLAALMAAALADAGLAPPKHLVAVKIWNMALLLLSRQPLTMTELNRIRRFAAAAGLTLAYPAVDSPLQEVIRHPHHPPGPFHLAPPSDNHPYFSHFLSLKAVPLLLARQGRAGLVLTEWAYVIMLFTLLLLASGGIVLILLPLVLSQEGPRTAPGLPLTYFTAIGIGFMAVEMLLIARLGLPLADPVYAAAAVITAILVFAGIGSALTSRLQVGRRHLIAATATVCIALLLLALLPADLPPLARLLLAWRGLVILLFLAPPALAMSLFFPTGIQRLHTAGQDALVPWAWAVNGYASVITPPLALLLALSAGLNQLALAAAIAYVAAVLLLPPGRCAPVATVKA